MILDGNSLGGLGTKQVLWPRSLMRGRARFCSSPAHASCRSAWLGHHAVDRVYIVLMLQTDLSCLMSPLPIVPYIKSPLSVVRIVVRFKGCFMLRFRFRRCFVLVMVHFWVFNPPRCEVVIEFLKLRRSLTSFNARSQIV